MAALVKVDWSVFGKCVDECGAEEARACRNDDDECAEAPCKGRPVMPAAVSRQVRDISAAEVRAEKKRVRSEARLSRNDAKQAARNAASKLAARPALVVDHGVVRASFAPTTFSETLRATLRRELADWPGARDESHDVELGPCSSAPIGPEDFADVQREFKIPHTVVTPRPPGLAAFNDGAALDRIAEVLRRHPDGMRAMTTTIGDIVAIIRQTGRTT